MILVSKTKTIRLDAIAWEDLKFALRHAESKEDAMTRWYYEGVNHEFETTALRNLVDEINDEIGDQQFQL